MTTSTPTALFGLIETARIDVGATEYVVYSEPGGSDDFVLEGCDFDTETEETDYSLWCADTGNVADVGTLRAVARRAGLDSVSSEPGVHVYAEALHGITEPVVVETMPASYRGAHFAAGNRGHFPGNGATRVVMSRLNAEDLEADDSEWTAIVRPATENDADHYGVRR